MSENVLIFEQFDDAAGNDPASVRAQQERAADYAEGFAAGEAAALSRAMEQNSQLQRAADALNAKLAVFDDTAASYLCEALAETITKIFPALTANGFTHEMVAALNDVANKNDSARLVVKANPASLETITAAISTMSIADRTETIADESLTDFEIRASWDHGGVTIDTEKATARFIASLEKAKQELRDED